MEAMRGECRVCSFRYVLQVGRRHSTVFCSPSEVSVIIDRSHYYILIARVVLCMEFQESDSNKGADTAGKVFCSPIKVPIIIARSQAK